MQCRELGGERIIAAAPSARVRVRQAEHAKIVGEFFEREADPPQKLVRLNVRHRIGLPHSYQHAADQSVGE